MIDPFDKTVDEWVQDVQNGVNNFAADMRDKNIHVGLGSPPACVICGIWPCDGEAPTERAGALLTAKSRRLSGDA